jgi:hypothetical protein
MLRTGRPLRVIESLAALLDVLDPAVRHDQPVCDHVAGVLLHRLAECPVDPFAVLRVNTFDKAGIGGIELQGVDLEDPVDFIRPREPVADQIQVPVAQPGHLFRLAQPISTLAQQYFCLPPFREIDPDGGGAGQTAQGESPCADPDGTKAARFGTVRRIERHRFPLTDPIEVLADHSGIVFSLNIGDRELLEFLSGVSEALVGNLIEFDETTVGEIDQHDCIRGLTDDGGELFFPLTQQSLGGPTFGHVEEETDALAGLTVPVEHEFHLHPHPDEKKGGVAKADFLHQRGAGAEEGQPGQQVIAVFTGDQIRPDPRPVEKRAGRTAEGGLHIGADKGECVISVGPAGEDDDGGGGKKESQPVFTGAQGRLRGLAGLVSRLQLVGQ